MKQSSEQQKERIRTRRAKVRENLIYRLPRTYAASRLQGEKLLQHTGNLSILEWRVLWDLVEAGPMTIRDLADIQRSDPSQLSRALPAIRDKGFVTMTRHSGDGRQVLVELTEAGKAAYNACAPDMQNRRNALRAAFSSEEMDTFLRLMDKLEDFLHLPIDAIVQNKPPE